MSTPEHVMHTYVAMWNATDEQERSRLAKQALAEDAIVIYPTVEAHGRSDLVAAIGRFQQQVPGASFVETSGIEHHHGWLHASWRLVRSDGTVVMDGEDVAEVADDGRRCRVMGFRNPLPPRS